MKTWKWIIASIIVLVIGWGLYSLISAKKQMDEEATELSAQASNLIRENNEISNQIDYLENPDNLKKVLMEQTSYRPEGEKMFIITSGNISTSSTSTKK